MKLLNKINENNEINMKVLPLWLNGPRSVLNSLCKVLIIIFQITIYREGINQKAIGIMITALKVLIQLIDKFRIFVEGSKVEKRFVIIFNLNIFGRYFYFVWKDY